MDLLCKNTSRNLCFLKEENSMSEFGYFSISILRPHGWVPNLKTAQKNIESTEGWTKLLRSFSVFPVGENYRHLHDAWGASATVHKF